jgi:hypothetical protein
MPVPSSYVYDLHRRRHLLIRSRDVTGSDEDAQIAILLAQDDAEKRLPPPTFTLTTAKRRFVELKVDVPPKRRLTKLDDMQRSIKQEKLDNIVIEIDDASDEEETVRSRKAKGKGRRVGEVIVVDDEDGRSSHYSTLSLSITFSSSLCALSLSPDFP